MIFVPMETMETPRLLLRQVRGEDLPEYHSRLTSDPEVARYMLWEARGDIAHTEAAISRIRSGCQAGERYHWAIALKEDDSLIGTIALLGFDRDADSASFAYMLGRDYWNRGLGTEALEAVLRFAFGKLEIGCIVVDHFAENPASGAVMRKLGMEPAGLLPGKYEKNGIRHDAVQYRLAKEAWNRWEEEMQ